MLDQFRYATSQLDDADIPLDVSNIIKNLIDVVSKQQQQINNINSRCEQVEDNSNKAIEQLVVQMKAHDNYTQQEITKQINKASQNDKINKRISSVEESLRKLRSTIDETEKWSNTRFDMIEKKQQDDNADVRSLILTMQQQPMEMPSTYRNEEDQPHVVDGTTDISPLIRGIYRDSRRLDGFDELISQTRNECKEIVDSVISMQENLVQFNHNIHDLSITDGKLSKRITDITEFFSESLDNNDKHIIELYAVIIKLSTILHSAVSISTEAFDSIENILTRLSSRMLPPLPSMGECQLEAFALREEVQDKKTLYEDDRQRYKKTPDGILPPQIFKDVSVKKMTKKKEKFDIKNIVFQEDTTKFNKSMNDTTTLMMMVEDLTDNVAHLKHAIAEQDEQMKEIVKQQNNVYKDITDAKSTDRSLAKFENVITKLMNRVTALESKPKTVVVKENKRSPISDNYIDPPLTSRTFSREGSLPPKRIGATSAPMTARSQRGSSRIVSDRINPPY